MRKEIGDDVDLKKEASIVAVTTSISGLAAVALGADSLSAATIGLVGLLTTLLILFLFHWVSVSRSMDEKLRGKVGETFTALQGEKAKNAEPKLAGRINCLDHDIAWDLENFGLDEAMPMKLKATFALNVTLWNETPAATTVSGFSLCVFWRNEQRQADKLPVEGYSVQRSFPKSEALDWGYEVRSEPLVAFPNNVEITDRNHTDGWVRFLAREIPSESVDKAVPRRDVTWKLYAHDRKGQVHKVYEGTWDLPPCGNIERNDKFLFA